MGGFSCECGGATDDIQEQARNVIVEKLAQIRAMGDAGKAVEILAGLLEVTELAVRIMDNDLTKSLLAEVTGCVADKEAEGRIAALDKAIERYVADGDLVELPKAWEHVLEHSNERSISNDLRVRLSTLVSTLMEDVAAKLSAAAAGGRLNIGEQSTWTRSRTALGLCEGIIQDLFGFFLVCQQNCF